MKAITSKLFYSNALKPEELQLGDPFRFITGQQPLKYKPTKISLPKYLTYPKGPYGQKALRHQMNKTYFL